MNDIVNSVLIGIVEGLTEFLPVSSTAHIRLTQAILHIDAHDPFWKMFAVVIQLGAVLCLPVYFAKEIAKLVKSFPKGGRAGEGNVFQHPLSLVMIAFVVTAGPAWLLKKTIDMNLENYTVMGAALLIGGAIMWAVDSTFTQPRIFYMEDIGIVRSIWIGACQILSAVFPGTSRSMSTIAAGQVVGMSRTVALEFSFFLSMPTMFAATLYDLKKSIHPAAKDIADKVQMTGHYWVVLGIGFIVSFIVAFGVVAWFMAWVRKRGFTPFAIYRIVLGVIVLWLARGGLST